ncbi:MAG: hypothetical protein WB798_00145, partial [Nocardioidaceae bacterium]
GDVAPSAGPAGVLVAEAFVAGAFVAGAFVAGAFVAGAFVAGAFVAGAFVAAALVAAAFVTGASGAFVAVAFRVGSLAPGAVLVERGDGAFAAGVLVTGDVVVGEARTADVPAAAVLAAASAVGAVAAGAFFAGVFFAGVFLAWAFLAWAFLAGAFFAGAFFAGAFFAGAFFAAGALLAAGACFAAPTMPAAVAASPDGGTGGPVGADVVGTERSVLTKGSATGSTGSTSGSGCAADRVTMFPMASPVAESAARVSWPATMRPTAATPRAWSTALPTAANGSLTVSTAAFLSLSAGLLSATSVPFLVDRSRCGYPVPGTRCLVGVGHRGCIRMPPSTRTVSPFM